MHIPPAYYKREAKRFLAGVILGGCFAYIIFIYIYGEMYEKAIEETMTAKTELQEAGETIEQLQKEQQSLPGHGYVETIEIRLQNSKDLSVDKLTRHELVQKTKDLLKPVHGTEISKLSGHEDLIITTVENGEFKIDDFLYRLSVTKLVISTNLVIEADMKVENG